MQESQSTIIYNNTNAKNWLIVYHLLTHIKKCLLPIIEGHHFLSIYARCILGKVKLNQGKMIFVEKFILQKQQGA